MIRAPHCSLVTAAVYTKPEHGSDRSAHQQRNGHRTGGAYVRGDIIQPLKGGNSANCRDSETVIEEVSQKEKNKYRVTSLVWRSRPMTQTDLSARTQEQRHKERMDGPEKQGWAHWGPGTDSCTPARHKAGGR